MIRRIKSFLFGDEELMGVIPMSSRALRRRCLTCGNKKEFWWCLLCRPCTKDKIELLDMLDEAEASWKRITEVMKKRREEEEKSNA